MSSLFERAVPATVVTALRHRLHEPPPAARIPLTEPELFDVLADNRRRGTIDRLSGTDGQTARRALAVELAADELHMSREHVPEARVDEIDEELERTHLPMLEDAGIVRWDAPRGQVSPGRSLEPVAEVLDDVGRLVEPAHDRPCEPGIHLLTTPWVPTDEA